MSKKKTPWFSGTTPPVRDGVYELRGRWFAKYKRGKGWFFTETSVRYAATTDVLSVFNTCRDRNDSCWDWRGLAEMPQ